MKIGRNDPCICGSGKKYKKCCLIAKPIPYTDDEGIHYISEGPPPSKEEVENMTKQYQENIRNSPLWDQLVEEHGLEKAEEILKECKAKVD